MLDFGDHCQNIGNDDKDCNMDVQWRRSIRKLLDLSCFSEESQSYDWDFNEGMLWFCITGRMLDFRDSGQEIENYGFDEGFNQETLWF